MRRVLRLTGLLTLLVAAALSPCQQSAAAVPYPVPHRSWIKLGLIAYQGSMTQAQIDWAAAHFDWFDSPDPSYLAQYKADTDATMVVYDNYYCLYVGDDKWNAMMAYAAAHGIGVDSMLIHYSQTTTVTFGGETHTLAAGSRIPTYGWYGTNGDLTKNGARVMANPGSAHYRAFNASYQQSLTGAQATGAAYDGIFVDNGGPGVLGNQGSVSSGGAIAEYPDSPATASANYDLDLYATFDAAKAALGGKVQCVNMALPWEAAYSHVDQVFEEYRIQPSSAGFSFWGNFANWLANQAEADAAGVASIISAHGLGSTATDSPEEKLFALAAYYIGANPSVDYFCRQDLNAGDPQTYGWFGALEYNVGSPQATYSIIASGTDSNGNDYTVYGRQYTRALMLARVSSGGVDTPAAVTMNLPAPSDNPTGVYYPLNADGTLGSGTTQVSVTHAQGAVLIKASALSPTKPVADFSGTPLAGPYPLTVQFPDLSSGVPSSWYWTFGDTGTSVAQNPVHQYASAGTYTVSLTASNSYGSNTKTRTNYISVSIPSAPTADFSGTPTSGGIPLTVQFADTSTGAPTSWSWTFGDGGTATSQNPSHTYTAAGTYTVTLTATNSMGSNTQTKTGYITASAAAAPIPQITSVTITPASAVVGSPVIVSVTARNAGTISSYAGITVDLPSFTHAGDSSYISLVNGSWGRYDLSPAGTIADNRDGSRSALPYAVAECWAGSWTAGGTYVFSITVVPQSTGAFPIYVRAWANTSGWTGTQLDPASSPALDCEQYPVYVYSVTAGSGASAPVASFTASPTSGTAPLAVQFTDTSTGTPAAWSWTFGDGGTSSVQNPSHQYTAAGTYTVLLTVTNGAGSSTATRPGYITVNAASALALSESSNRTSARPGDVITYTISYSNDGAVPLSNALISDLIPPNTTYVVGSASSGGSYDGMKVTWNLGSLAPGAKGTVTFQVTVN